MKHPDIGNTAMTDEQLNIAICEWRGWKKRGKWWSKPGHEGGQSLGDFDAVLPSHLTDLNAMHEAEKGLAEQERYKYLYQLEMACHVSGAHARNKNQNFTIITATARQRAIALLRVVKPELFQ